LAIENSIKGAIINFLVCIVTYADAVQASLLETKRLLLIRLHETMNTTLNNPAVVDELFDYLIQFSIQPDFCPLRSRVARVVKEILYSITVHTVFDSDLDSAQLDISDEQRDCFANITSSYITEFTERIIDPLQRLLQDYKVYVEAMQLAKEVVSIISNHKFSPACTAALTRMKHCAYCGGYRKFPPCLNLCLNTISGCFADVTELELFFERFLASLQRLSKTIDSDLEPDALLNNQLKGFTDISIEMKILAPQQLVVS